MKVWKVFFLGLVYGWCMKWIIDEIFTKEQYRIITNENVMLRDRLNQLELSRPLETRPILQTPSQAEPAPRPTATAQPRTASARAQKDDLKLIKGIGPQMEKKLNDAGIRTFAQMSRLTTTDLQNILGISKRVVQSADNLITQARKFAQQKAKK